MKKKYSLKITALYTLIFFSAFTYSQEILYSQDFEGSTDFVGYQLYNSGGSAVNFAVIGSDYITRATPGSLPLGNTVTGFTGNVIAFEDHDGAGFIGQHYIDTDAINITGASGLTLKIRLAAARGGDGNRYESGDFLQVQVSIDGGGFQTVINTGGTSSNNNYYYDFGANGITGSGDDILVNQTSQEINVTVAGSGASLVVRVLFDLQGPHEEVLFDDIVVEAAMVLSIEETKLVNSVKFYPNPSNGKITIKNSGIALYKAQISDLNGRVIINYDLKGTTEDKQLNLDKLPSGIYLMTISSENSYIVEKLIIN